MEEEKAGYTLVTDNQGSWCSQFRGDARGRKWPACASCTACCSERTEAQRQCSSGKQGSCSPVSHWCLHARSMAAPLNNPEVTMVVVSLSRCLAMHRHLGTILV